MKNLKIKVIIDDVFSTIEFYNGSENYPFETYRCEPWSLLDQLKGLLTPTQIKQYVETDTRRTFQVGRQRTINFLETFKTK